MFNNASMTNNDMSIHATHHRRTKATAPFRLAPVPALIAAATIFTAFPVYAQQDKDKTISELQAEITRLKQQIAEQQQPGAAGTATPPPSAAASGATATAPAPATADDPVALDAVVVRSRNRIERLQDVPLSVSAIGGRDLDRLQSNDIDAITKRLGNINWNLGNQRTSSISIRGIGKQSQTEAQDPSVGVIVDGIPLSYSALTSSYYFFDLDSVEVARGPQGTLLGKNSTIGAINFTTRRPSFTPSADWSLTFGEGDKLTGTFAGGGPIIDNLLAWRGSFVVDRQKGDLHNVYESNRDQTFQNINRVAGRTQFLLTPTPDFNARVSFEVQPRSDETTNARTIFTPTPTTYSNGAVNPLSSDVSTRLARRWFQQDPNGFSYSRDYLYGGIDGHTVNYDSAKGLVTGSRGVSGELNWNIGDLTLTSITGYRDYHFNAQNDDNTPFDVSRNGGGFWNDYRQITQELRVANKKGGVVDYQAGIHLSSIHNDVEYRQQYGNDAGAWFANAAQYGRLDADGAGRYLLQNSLDGLTLDWNRPGVQLIRNKSAAVFGQADWHLADKFTLTTGVRLTREDRQNTGYSSIKSNGNGYELNPESVRDVFVGGFNSTANGALAAGNSVAQLQLADYLATKYFGVAATSTPGAAYNSLTPAQRQQVADAKAIRLAQIGPLFGPTAAEPFKKTQPAFLITPSYKYSDDLTGYVSLQYGQKAGIAQINNGVSALVKPEKTSSLELGFKSQLFDKTLTFNANTYYTQIKDFQQTINAIDVYTTTLRNDGTNYYVTATGNVPKVVTKGVEIDGTYNGIRNLSLRFAGAYNDARYKKFPNAAQPVENNYPGAPASQDLSGQTLPGANKYSLNLGADYRHPVFDNKVFLVSWSTTFISKYNSDNALSSYGWIPGHSTTDLSIGLGRADGSFTANLLVKNLLDDTTPLAQTWNSYTPAKPRWIGILFTGKI